MAYIMCKRACCVSTGSNSTSGSCGRECSPAQVKISMTSSIRQNARAASDTPTKHEQATDTGLCSSALR